jgi:predicted Fe-Mo cluster-binding NifX family protein
MRLAIAVEKGRIATHYAHAEHYVVYDLDGSSFKEVTQIPHDKKAHIKTYDDLAELNVQALVVDMIGDNGFEHLLGRSIQVYYGQKGETEAFLSAFLNNEIALPSVYTEDQSTCAL